MGKDRRAAIHLRQSRFAETMASKRGYPASTVKRIVALGIDPKSYSAGITRQLLDALQIADRKGWQITDRDQIYIDDDTSASKFSRKTRSDYVRLLQDIENDEIYGVISAAEDRTHRQVLELAEFIKLCREHDVQPVTPAAEYDLSDPDQVSMWFIKVRFAEAEVEKISRRLRRERLQSAEAGQPHRGGSRKFGWTGWGQHTVSDEQVQREQAVIREAAQRIIAGDSLRSVVIDLNERGIPTSRGGPWMPQTVRKMLMAPRLAGYRAHQGKLYPGVFEPILDKETWNAVRAILTDPERSKALRGGVRRYLLSGIAACGLCKRPLYGRQIDGRTIYYCLPSTSRIGCGKIRRLGEPVEFLVVESMFRAAESPTFFKMAAADTNRDDPINALYEQLVRDQGLLDRLEDKVAQELISEPAARRNRAQIERRMEQTQAKIDRLRGDQVVSHVPRNLRQVWPDCSLDRKRAILAAVLNKLEIYPQKSSKFDPDTVVPDWRM